MHWLLVLLAALTAITPAASRAAMPTEAIASFDCRRAASPAERMVCADPLLATYDRGVAAAYRAALAARYAHARDGQRAWLRERDRCGDLVCLRRSYAERLQSLFEGVPERGALVRPDRTGWLTMLPLGSGDYAFHINAFHQGLMPSAVNTGDATGVVRTRGGAGTYLDDVCAIAFEAIVRGRGWRVDVNDDVACGAGHNVRLGGRFGRSRA